MLKKVSDNNNIDIIIIYIIFPVYCIVCMSLKFF